MPVTSPSSEPALQEGGPHPPDWDLVPFEVGCARCGHDLRGLSDPKCPACGLEFDWTLAVPIEQLTCGKCGYHLYGLRDTRCPECGQAFAWQQVLDDYHRRRKPLFEYHWRTRPVRSFFGTWLSALRPGQFWRTVEVHDPVQIKPLLWSAVLFIVLLLCSLIVFGAVAEWLQDWTRFNSRRWSSRRPTSVDFPGYLLRAASALHPYFIAWMLAIWSGCVLAALMIFRQSMRKCRARTGHVVRVWVLSVPLWAPPVVTLAMLAICHHSAIEARFDDRIYLAAATLSVIGLSTYGLGRAYRLYLHMPHSEAVALASQVIAVMGAIIGEMLTLPNAGDTISFYLFQWLAAY